MMNQELELKYRELDFYFPQWSLNGQISNQLGSNLASECIRKPSFLQDSCKFFDSLARFLQGFRLILQYYLKESCRLLDSYARDVGHQRGGAYFFSSRFLLAFACSLMTRACALLSPIKSATENNKNMKKLKLCRGFLKGRCNESRLKKIEKSVESTCFCSFCCF